MSWLCIHFMNSNAFMEDIRQIQEVHRSHYLLTPACPLRWKSLVLM